MLSYYLWQGIFCRLNYFYVTLGEQIPQLRATEIVGT